MILFKHQATGRTWAFIPVPKNAEAIRVERQPLIKNLLLKFDMPDGWGAVRLGEGPYKLINTADRLTEAQAKEIFDVGQNRILATWKETFLEWLAIAGNGFFERDLVNTQIVILEQL